MPFNTHNELKLSLICYYQHLSPHSHHPHNLIYHSVFSPSPSATLMCHPRFAVIVFTSRKNGGKLPGTEGKPGNYHLPIGKKSVYQQRFFTVNLNFQWWHLDPKLTHSGNFENYQKITAPKFFYHVQPGKLLVNTVNHGKTVVTANLDAIHLSH